MKDPHQALIEETKLKLVYTFVLSDDSWDVILQATIDTVIEGAVAAAYKNAIELSDKIELSADLPDGGVEQWKAFKRFRNTLRDTYLTPLTDKE